jgi:hypothetical protein
MAKPKHDGTAISPTDKIIQQRGEYEENTQIVPT